MQNILGLWLHQAFLIFNLYKEKYEDIEHKHEAEERPVLFLLGNNKEYYFGNMYFKKNGIQIKIDCSIHIGIVQDSVLCINNDYQSGNFINFLHFTFRGKYIEFYSWKMK
ncbi:MAG TPA: hypothetical protein DCM59_13470 [Clostridium sp.]|nr:hypothetical protein [Clostridium sp.]